MTIKCILSLGSNIDDRNLYLTKARTLITKNIGRIVSLSGIYETEPWGFNATMNFYNQVLSCNTYLKPLDVLQKCMTIEKELGRKRTSEAYESRPIDIDILFYGNEVINYTSLKVPHPRMQDRNFVLVPLCEIEPDFIHPVLQKKIVMLRKNCPDRSWIKKIPLQ